MKSKKALIILFITFGLFQSCLVPLSPKHHYFTPTDNIEKNNPKLQIFSTPRYKSYVVTNIDMNAQVFIQSSVFENPNEFYLMKNQTFFETQAKQHELEKRDGRFYRTDDYNNVRLKIINGEGERLIVYKLTKKVTFRKRLSL